MSEDAKGAKLAATGAVRYRVLLVDDEKLVRFTISSYLRRANFEITEAASPEEAMAFVKRTHFDAILSDVVMGEIDGFVFRDMIRQFDMSVPVIFLTSMVNDCSNWLLDKISEDVRSYFIGKGASREMMQYRIRQIIASYEQERESAQIKHDFAAGLEVASFVQQSLLPQWVDVDRVYNYGVAWRPLEKVSGDLYEWIRISRETALVILGDVSGHGIRSALAMTAIQSFLKRFQEFDDHRAQRVHAIARSIHEFVDANFRDLIYMVGLVAYVDFAHNRIRYINAGFPEVACIAGKTGERIPLNPEDRGTFPFGLMRDSAYTLDDVVEATFPDDAVFVMATDGVTDGSADREGDQSVPKDVFDEVCSLAVQADYAAGTLFQTSASILKALVEMGYNCQQDDRMVITFAKAVDIPARFIHEVEISPEAIDGLSERAGMYAGELTGDPELSTKVQLVLEEFLMNVSRHGFEGYVRHHEFGVVTGMVVAGQFELTVWERGSNYDKLSKMSLAETQRKLDERNDLFADSGRGTSIMRIISDSGVRHERISNVNKTVFRIPFKKGQS